MKATIAVVGLAAAALTLAPTAGAQEAATPKFQSLSAACSPGTEGVVMLKAGACPGPFLDKFEYAPGETIKIKLTFGTECVSHEATSTGFAAPVALKQTPVDAGAYQLTGEAKAGTVPGDYTATIKCDKVSRVSPFAIKIPDAPPTTTTPPTTTSPAPGKPKPPITKPKGAPDTGGGGTTISIR
ncbi:hypothetical protein ABZ345_21625 [Lentzea sp. NPDC005914]|uniref:hypothetical protein n=1 Tax=Lentzea sp. NPDC005914 TaxID=3154572 RepID=UPI0033E5D390